MIACKNDNVINIKGFRKLNLPYIFIWIVYYAWVIVFSTWWTLSPSAENTSYFQFRALLHIVNLLSSGIFILIIRKEWFVKTAHMGSIFLIMVMIIYLMAKDATVQFISTIAIGILLGCVNISILIPFVFNLNNTEKLYAVVGSNLLINAISLFYESKYSDYLMNNHYLLISFIVMIVALSSTLFFKDNWLASDEKSVELPKFHKRIYLTLFFNCVFAILCKGVGKGIINVIAGGTNIPVVMWYYIGGLIGCFVYFVIYGLISKAFIWLGNITFGLFSMGLFCNVFIGEIPSMAIPFAILFGISSTVGMINMYYIIGVVGKKYDSMHYMKLSVFLIGICGGISGVVLSNLIQSFNTVFFSAAVSIVSMAVMLLFIMSSPLVSQSYYHDDWAKDSEKRDIDNDQCNIFKKYGLSKREIEVCKLLLQGYTLRQISGILSIAYSTVNTYCTSSYRKLGINSRTELMVMFKDYSTN